MDAEWCLGRIVADLRWLLARYEAMLVELREQKAKEQ